MARVKAEDYKHEKHDERREEKHLKPSLTHKNDRNQGG